MLKQISYIMNQNAEKFIIFSEYSLPIVFQEIYLKDIYH